MTNELYDKKEQVQQLYGERARKVTRLNLVNLSDTLVSADGLIDAGIDKSLGAYPNIYTEIELTGMPVGAIASSAGCGNPTALAGLKIGERVLDLGSGGGIDCFLAARKVGDSGSVIGLDMTDDMLKLARRNAKTLGISNVSFVEGHIENIPLPDNAVDVVISNCVVCLSTDKDAVARESFRVLSNGGRIHISDIVALGPMPEDAREDAFKWSSCVSGAEEEDVYLDHLRSAGFIDISIEYEGEPRSQENNIPDISSVKVVAYKP